MNILFVIAMNVELIYLIEKFQNITENKIGAYTYYQSQIKDKTIYILKTDIGLINTAIALTKFLNKIKPDLIINAGTAGALDAKYNVGDIILAKEVININSLDTVYKDRNEGSNSLEWKLKTFVENDDPPDFIDGIKIYYGNKELLNKIKRFGEYLGLKIYEGRIGSGDVWNKEKDRVLYFSRNYTTACEEMEIYSIYQICDQEKIPCIGIKIFSDNIMSGQEFDTRVSEPLDLFLYHIFLNL